MPIKLSGMARELHPGPPPARVIVRCKHYRARFVWRWYNTAYGPSKRFGFECVECLEWGVRSGGLQGHSEMAGEKRCIEIWGLLPDDAGFRDDDEISRARNIEYQKKLEEHASHTSAWWDWYDRYLNSSAWYAIRGYILRRDNHTCQKCSGPGEQVHHLTYERVGNEDEADLITLCTACHNAEHGR